MPTVTNLEAHPVRRVKRPALMIRRVYVLAKGKRKPEIVASSGRLEMATLLSRPNYEERAKTVVGGPTEICFSAHQPDS